MISKRRWLALLPGMLAVPALPGLAHAQRCVVAEIEIPTMEVRVGAREQMLVIFRDRNGIPCAEDPAWSATSQSPAIARVDRGFIVGVSAGTAIIQVSTGVGRSRRTQAGAVNVVAEAPVAPAPSLAPPVVTPPPTVVPSGARGPGAATLQYQREGTGPAFGIVTDPLRMRLLPGEQRFLGYSTADVRGGPAERLPLQFAVEPASALSFVTVDSIGVVTATDTGTATIRVSAVGRPTLTTLVPVQVRADSVAFSSRRVNMAPSTTDTVPMNVPAQDRDVDVRSRVFRFESSDTMVAIVHLFEPVIESRRPGSAIITATNPRLRTVQTVVNVFPPVTAIQLADSAITIAVRQTRQVRMRPVADTTYIREAPMTLRGLDTTRVAAQYDTTTGTFTFIGRASGTTAVTMRVQNGRDSAAAVERTLRIRVVAGGLMVSRSRIGLGAGERAPVQLAVLDEQRRPIPNLTPEGVTWTSSDTSVARYENGQVVARGVGPARITARAPAGWDSTATIDVYVVSDQLIVKQRAGAWNLWGRTVAGAWQQLTNDSLLESFPAWAPDLTRIAYVQKPANRPRGGDLMIANADGSNPQRVFTMESTTVFRPQFVRPSGDVVVFELLYFDGRSEVWSVGRDGRNAQRRTAGPAGAHAGFPAVSPNGERLLYVSQRTGVTGSYDIFIANFADGAGERRLTTHVRFDDSPAWAPDGESFFFLRDEMVQRQAVKRVYRWDLRNDSASAVSPPTMSVTAFSVSGDGRALALNVSEQGVTKLYTLEVATGTPTAVNLDVSEILQQGSAAAWRPATPAPAPAPTAPAPRAPTRP